MGYKYPQHRIASLLPLMEAFGIATAAEVDVATLRERLQREAESAGRLLVLPPKEIELALRRAGEVSK